MNNALTSVQQNIHELFYVDDWVPCLNKAEAFRIVGIHADGIELVSADDAVSTMRLDYASLAAAMDPAASLESGQAVPLLQCFMAEYQARVEQARRDAEVDAMWRSAIVCQIQ